MRLKTQNNISAGFGIFSAIGVIFLLLLFFMQQFSANIFGINIQLPESNETRTPVNGLYVLVTMEGRYFINKEEVNHENIEAVLSSYFKNNTSPSFVIAADQGALHGDVMFLLKIAAKKKYKAVIAVNHQE